MQNFGDYPEIWAAASGKSILANTGTATTTVARGAAAAAREIACGLLFCLMIVPSLSSAQSVARGLQALPSIAQRSAAHTGPQTSSASHIETAVGSHGIPWENGEYYNFLAPLRKLALGDDGSPKRGGGREAQRRRRRTEPDFAVRRHEAAAQQRWQLDRGRQVAVGQDQGAVAGGTQYRAVWTLIITCVVSRSRQGSGTIPTLLLLSHVTGSSGEEGLDWEPDEGALPGQLHQRHRRTIATSSAEDVPIAVELEQIEIPAIYHSIIGTSSAQHQFYPMKIAVQEVILESTKTLLETAVQHEFSQFYPNVEMPPVGNWHTDVEMPKRMASILQRRDKLARQTTRYRAFQESILATHASVLRPKHPTDDEDVAPPSKRHTEQQNVTSDNILVRVERQLYEWYDVITTGVKVITTVATLIMSTFNARQMDRMHQQCYQARRSSAANQGRLESMAGTVAALAKSTHNFFEVMNRDNQGWDYSILWDDLFDEFVATTELHMEVITSAAANTLHPKILPQVDIAAVAQDLADLYTTDGLIPIVDSPADYISLSTSLSLLRGESGNYVGWQLLTLIPLSMRAAQLSLFRFHEVPIRVNDGRYVTLAPGVDIIIAVTTKSGTQKAQWTSITASALAECKQSRRHYLCLSLGALRPPLTDDHVTDGQDPATCAYALYAGLETLALATCQQREVIEPVLVKQLSAYQFAVYVKEPEEIHVTCPKKENVMVPPRTHRIQRLAVMHLTPGCVATVAGAVLYADDVVRAPTERVYRIHVDDQLAEAMLVWDAKQEAARRQETLDALGNKSISVFSDIADKAVVLARMDEAAKVDQRQGEAISTQARSTMALFTTTAITGILLVVTLALMLYRSRAAEQAVTKFIGCRTPGDIHHFLRIFLGMNFLIDHIYVLDNVAEEQGRKIHNMRRDLHALVRAVFPRNADEFGPPPPAEYIPPCKLPKGQTIPSILDRAVMSDLQEPWDDDAGPERKRRKFPNEGDALIGIPSDGDVAGASGGAAAPGPRAAGEGRSNASPRVGRQGRPSRK